MVVKIEKLEFVNLDVLIIYKSWKTAQISGFFSPICYQMHSNGDTSGILFLFPVNLSG